MPDLLISLVPYLIPIVLSVLLFIFWTPLKSKMIRERNMANIISSPEISQNHGCFDSILSPDAGIEIMGPCYRDGNTGDRLCFVSMETGSKIWLNGAEVEKYVFTTMPHPKDPFKRMFMYGDVNAVTMKTYLKNRFGITDSIFGKAAVRKKPPTGGKK